MARIPITLIFFIAALSLGAPCGSIAADLLNGEKRFTVCVACHGASGAGIVALGAPPLAGQAAWYVVEQLKNFQRGVRGTHPKDVYGAQMRPIVTTLRDEQALVDVAAYIETLPAPSSSPANSGDVTRGQLAYAPCIACHGQHAEGKEALHAPRLALLPDWYIVRQLENFRAGIRGTHHDDVYGAQMRPLALVLTDAQQIADVAAYISTRATSVTVNK